MKRSAIAVNVVSAMLALSGACSDGGNDDPNAMAGAMAGAAVAGTTAGTVAGTLAGTAGTTAGTMAGTTAGTMNVAGATAGTLAGTTGGAAGAMAGMTAGTTAGTMEMDASMPPLDLPNFSFFVTSLRAMRELSGSQNGFGGDLSYGETGAGAGLRGADKICTEIAEQSMPGSGAKEWHAFLSAVAAGPDGGPVHAKDRVGTGPWYDRLGRLLANDLEELIQERPSTADMAIIDDFPNEDGVPNHNPDGTGDVDNHDFLTGSNDLGEVYAMDMKVTCNDWTNSVPNSADAPRVGHSWPRRGGFGMGGSGGGSGMGGTFPFPGGTFPGGGGNINMVHWISSLDEAGCGAGVGIIEMGPPMENNPTVGSGGGYGGIYCFAMQP